MLYVKIFIYFIYLIDKFYIYEFHKYITLISGKSSISDI